MAYFDGNVLKHNWFNSRTFDVVGTLAPNHDKRKPQKFVFTAYCIDATFRRYYYERPTAEEVFASFLQWQSAGV